MKQYQDFLRDILVNGRLKSDRTGTGTISTFGRQMRFDLTGNKLPVITTKKIHLKSVIHELLWFIQGDTNIKYLKDNGVRIWDEWRQPYREDRPVVFVEPVLRPYQPYAGDFSLAGIHATSELETALLSTWTRMMRRCYDPSAEKFPFYGAMGVSVDARWHDPVNFMEDAQFLPHWHYKKQSWDGFDLDKDYFGSNQYGPETTLWLSKQENNLYTKNARPVRVTTAEGLSSVHLSTNAAARAYNIPQSTLGRFMTDGVPTTLKGGNKRLAGWAFEEFDPGGRLARLKIIPDGELGPVYGASWRRWPGYGGETIDQLSMVVDQLRNNPDSRRIVLTAWNPPLLKDMALPPCHMLFQCFSRELSQAERIALLAKMNMGPSGNAPENLDKDMDLCGVPRRALSVQLYQRSADAFLGVPFNITSYALLTHMLAHVTGHVAEEFVWTGGDCHIYVNHLEQVELQLTREPFAEPTVRLNPRVRDITHYQFEDVVVENYHHHSAIQGKVAV